MKIRSVKSPCSRIQKVAGGPFDPSSRVHIIRRLQKVRCSYYRRKLVRLSVWLLCCMSFLSLFLLFEKGSFYCLCNTIILSHIFMSSLCLHHVTCLISS